MTELCRIYENGINRYVWVGIRVITMVIRYIKAFGTTGEGYWASMHCCWITRGLERGISRGGKFAMRLV